MRIFRQVQGSRFFSAGRTVMPAPGPVPALGSGTSPPGPVPAPRVRYQPRSGTSPGPSAQADPQQCDTEAVITAPMSHHCGGGPVRPARCRLVSPASLASHRSRGQEMNLDRCRLHKTVSIHDLWGRVTGGSGGCTRDGCCCLGGRCPRRIRAWRWPRRHRCCARGGCHRAARSRTRSRPG